MMVQHRMTVRDDAPTRRGFGAWLIDRLRPRCSSAPKLRVLEQIRVTPKQVLFLIEVEGERLLMAASDASAPAFYPFKKSAPAMRRRGPAAIRIEGQCS